MAKLLKEHMSSHLITIDCSETMGLAAEKMRMAKIHHLPVLNEFGEVVGILTEKDLHKGAYSEYLVGDFMSWPVKVVNIDTRLSDVVKFMIDDEVSSFLVADQDLVVGIITHEDLLRILLFMLEKPSLKDSIVGALNRITHTSPIGLVIHTLSEMGI